MRWISWFCLTACLVLVNTLPLAGQYTTMDLNGVTYGHFDANATWTLSVKGSATNTAFSLCMSKNGQKPGCMQNYGRTDANGAWQQKGVFDSNSVGRWAMWVQFPSGGVSNWIWLNIGVSVPTLTVNGVFSSNFGIADSWKLSLTDSPANVPVTLCFSKNNVAAGCTVFGSTDSTGKWNLTGKFDASSAGAWTIKAQMPTGAESNELLLAISPSAIASLTVNDVTSGQFIVSQNWGLDLTKADSSAVVKLCFRKNGVSQGCSNFDSTNSYNDWYRFGSFDSNSLGDWAMYVQMPSGQISNWLSFTIYPLAFDTVPPVFEIYSPSDTFQQTYNTTDGKLVMNGYAEDNVGLSGNIKWSNDRGGNGTLPITNDDYGYYAESFWTIPEIDLQLGSNNITLTAIDTAGNVGSRVFTVKYINPDRTAPVVTISSYYTGNGDFMSYLSGTVKEDVDIKSMSWSSDRGGNGRIDFYNDYNDPSATSWSWDTVAVLLASGQNVITVTATDTSGNVGTAKVTITCTSPPVPDTQSPYLTVATPASTNSTYPLDSNSPMDIQGLVYDNVGAMSVKWDNSLGGSGVCLTDYYYGNVLYYVCQAVPIKTGVNVITLTSKDNAGNSGSAKLTMPYATGPYIVVEQNYSNGYPYNPTFAFDSASQSFSGYVYDGAEVTSVTWSSDRSASGTAIVYTPEANIRYSWNINSIQLAEGANVITVTAKDASGQTATSKFTATYVPPGTIPGGPGTPSITINYVPQYGTLELVKGMAQHVDPQKYKVVIYIGFAGTYWWIKPYDSELTPLNPDGSWSCDIVTGGIDLISTDIVVYLIPNDAKFLDALGEVNLSAMDALGYPKAAITRGPGK